MLKYLIPLVVISFGYADTEKVPKNPAKNSASNAKAKQNRFDKMVAGFKVALKEERKETSSSKRKAAEEENKRKAEQEAAENINRQIEKENLELNRERLKMQARQIELQKEALKMQRNAQQESRNRLRQQAENRRDLSAALGAEMIFNDITGRSNDRANREADALAFANAGINMGGGGFP